MEAGKLERRKRNDPKLKFLSEIFILAAFALISLDIAIFTNSHFLDSFFHREQKVATSQKPSLAPSPTPLPTPILTSTPTRAPVYLPPVTLTPTPSSLGWGQTQKIGDHTYTTRIGMDLQNGTPKEILDALNRYRGTKGRPPLSWDQGLADFAKSRAELYAKSGLDGHKGFTDYVNNNDGFHKLGYYQLGENGSTGYTVNAVHLIEWVYASDAEHDNNQLSGEWSNVGIGVSGTSNDLIFGGKKM